MRAHWTYLAALACCAAAAASGVPPEVPEEIVALPPDPNPGIYLGRLRAPASYWAELLGVDIPTRIISVRPEGEAEIHHLRVLPYADLHRSGAEGVPLERFQPGERVEISAPPEGHGQYAVRVRDDIHAAYSDNQWYRIVHIDLANRKLTARRYAADENILFRPGRAPGEPPGSGTWRITLRTHYVRAGAPTSLALIRPGDLVQIRSVRIDETGVEARELIDPASMPGLAEYQRQAMARQVSETGIPGFVEDVHENRAEMSVVRGYERFLDKIGEGEWLHLQRSITPAAPLITVSLSARRQRRTTMRVTLLGDPEELASLPRSTTVQLFPEQRVQSR